MDASDLIKLRRNRTNFANYIIQRQRQQDGCQLHVNLESGSGSTNQISILNTIRNGATETTPVEEDRYLEEGACQHPILIYIAPTVILPPSGLPTASLWFDPSDINSIQLNGSYLTTFTDKTGNNNNGFATSNGLTPVNNLLSYNINPINGLGTVRMDNSGPTTQLLKVRNYNFNDQYISYAIVVRYISGVSGIVTTDDPGKYGRGIGCDNGKLRTISYSTFITWGGIDIPINPSGGTILVASISASNWIFSVNGTQNTLTLIQNKTPDNTDGLNIGCWNANNAESIIFDCGELLVYTSFLTSSEIEKVEGYFATKWGLLGNLPANHPYKNGYP
jgi:hypothetical protein